MKRLLPAILIAVCVSCYTEQAPGPVAVGVNEEFELAYGQLANVKSKANESLFSLAFMWVEDTRCPTPKVNCIVGGQVTVQLEAQAGDEKAKADLCLGDCWFTNQRGRYRIADSTDIRIQEKRFRIRLIDVKPHPGEEWDKPRWQERERKRAAFLVREL
ncbi:MAG: hypothetical protein MUD08_12285 [Cytophagales bacterium]|jgi:hypothetical protein|nr:hypothetical protein [Cytophagales bacterium]